MRLRTPLTELVGIDHPVVQTGMGWVAGARLVSATANAGGLGILASATMTLDELATAIGKVKAATDKPFGVNIRADAGDAADRVDMMIREGVRVASFALAPKQELISKLKDAGAVVIPSVGLAKHARKVASWGADAVIVQGGEGGGHTGPIATTLLLPSVLDAVSIPVIAPFSTSLRSTFSLLCFYNCEIMPVLSANLSCSMPNLFNRVRCWFASGVRSGMSMNWPPSFILPFTVDVLPTCTFTVTDRVLNPLLEIWTL